MADAQVIPLFRDKTPPDPAEKFVPVIAISEELQASVVETAYEMEQLWLAETPAEFTDRMRSIKAAVAAWPES